MCLAKPSRHLPVLNAHKDHPDQPDNQDNADLLVHLEMTALPVRQELLAHLDLKDQQDREERTASLDQLGLQEHPALDHLFHQDNLDRLDLLDLPAHLDQTVTLALLMEQVQLVLRERVVHLGPSDLTATLDRRDNQERQELLENEESARNTAPSTEESSSRMERDDKRQCYRSVCLLFLCSLQTLSKYV